MFEARCVEGLEMKSSEASGRAAFLKAFPWGFLEVLGFAVDVVFRKARWWFMIKCQRKL